MSTPGTAGEVSTARVGATLSGSSVRSRLVRGCGAAGRLDHLGRLHGSARAAAPRPAMGPAISAFVERQAIDVLVDVVRVGLRCPIGVPNVRAKIPRCRVTQAASGTGNGVHATSLAGLLLAHTRRACAGGNDGAADQSLREPRAAMPSERRGDATVHRRPRVCQGTWPPRLGVFGARRPRSAPTTTCSCEAGSRGDTRDRFRSSPAAIEAIPR